MHIPEEEEDTERLALEAIDSWHKKWTHRLSTDGRAGGPIVDRLHGEDVFLVHNIDYLKRRHRFKTMFAKLQIDSSADEVIHGKKGARKGRKTMVGAHGKMMGGGDGDDASDDDVPVDMVVFEEDTSLDCFQGDAELLESLLHLMQATAADFTLLPYP